MSEARKKINAKDILDRMRPAAGDGGMALANAFIHAYGAIGRGVRGWDAIAYLTDQAQSGKIFIEKDNWIYQDSENRRRVLGGAGDKVLSGIVQLSMLLHNQPFRKIGRTELDNDELAQKLKDSARKVLIELSKR